MGRCLVKGGGGVVAHTLPGCKAGAAVDHQGAEDGAEHLEALLPLGPAPQLNAQQGEDGGGRRLLLCPAWGRTERGMGGGRRGGWGEDGEGDGGRTERGEGERWEERRGREMGEIGRAHV